jgi:DNA gyrase subunit A
VSTIPVTQIKDKGSPITEKIILNPSEEIVTILTEQAKGYVALLSKMGKVRCLRHHLFGEHLKQGVSLFNPTEFGQLQCATWTPGEAELFIVTKDGIGIRFNEKTISPQGDLAIRVLKEDSAAGITAVYPDSSVFIIGADGKGTIRKMSGFSPNKSPGGTGKIVIKNNQVVGATIIDINDEIFLVTKSGKIIRFNGHEIPDTEGVVQGVNCIMMRSDMVTGLFRLPPTHTIQVKL